MTMLHDNSWPNYKDVKFGENYSERNRKSGEKRRRRRRTQKVGKKKKTSFTILRLLAKNLGYLELQNEVNR